jgi:hypothetical protein
MFDDGAVADVEPARARNANSRRAARLRFLRPFTRRLARANTPANVGNGHVRAIDVPRRLETCDASQLRGADSASGCESGTSDSQCYRGWLPIPPHRGEVPDASSASSD